MAKAVQTKIPEFKKTKSRRHYTVEAHTGDRYRLQNPRITRASARGKTTKLSKGGYRDVALADALDIKEAQNLKNGIMGMADRFLLDAETYEKLASMDDAKLLDMYRNNNLVFEVFFQYGGISYGSGQYEITDDSKVQDAQFLIENYERLYGKL